VKNYKVDKKGNVSLRVFYESVSGDYENMEDWGEVQNVFEDNKAKLIEFAKQQEDPDPQLLKRVAACANQHVRELFPAYKEKGAQSPVRASKRPAAVTEMVPKGTCKNTHDVYNLETYRDAIYPVYFAVGGKHCHVICRKCDTLLRDKPKKPSQSKPHRVCQNEYLDKCVCHQGVCNECWVEAVKMSSPNRGKRTRRTRL
jgi:hypothetical protein